MARVLLLVPAVALFFAAVGCAAPGAPAPPPVSVTVTASAQPTLTSVPSTEATTTVMITVETTTTTKAKDKRSLAEQRKAACRKDENQCYEPGTNTKCQTGGCVNAARA